MRSVTARVRAFAGTAPAAVAERCDFCGQALADEHAHVLDTQDARPRCACAACALLFPDTGPGRFRRSGASPQRLASPLCTDEQWTALGVPVGLAWFFRDGAARLRLQYPGAAGPVEAPQSSAALAEAIEPLRSLAPGVEAILVRRKAGASAAWRVPMDTCWHLSGLLRRHWRGFEGGAEVHAQLERLFKDLDRG